ncbi:UNVERIFIED_CONTAM: hypothetical protein H355_008920 [Colinus virginianus]|nr:hypothetical protein H355_008920 [Colinus virginianus]
MAAARGGSARGSCAPCRRFLWALLPPLFALCPAQTELPGSLGLSLHPPYFNLAETAGISATATCGEEEEEGGGRPELYCKLVGGPAAAPLGRAIQGQFCDYCNADDPNKAHPITNAIDGTERWWQSPPLSKGLKYNEVNVTLDLGQLFHVAYILIKFANSPRPDLWILERSVDFGRTYTPWQYFAHSKADCLGRFGKEANVPVRRNGDIICTTEYSRIVPLENGEIVVSLVNGRPGAKNFTYSPSLREFTKATNIRLHFLRTNTLLGHLISKAQRDPTVTRRDEASDVPWVLGISEECALQCVEDIAAQSSSSSAVLGSVTGPLCGLARLSAATVGVSPSTLALVTWSVQRAVRKDLAAVSASGISREKTVNTVLMDSMVFHFVSHVSAMVQECWVVIVMEIPGSAGAELDFRDFPVIPVQLAIFIIPSARNAIVTLLAHWTIHVILEDSVCVILTMLGLDVTSVLQVTTAIPAACLVSALLMVPGAAYVSQQQGSVSVRQVLQGDSVTDAFLKPTVSPTVKEPTVNATLQVALILILKLDTAIANLMCVEISVTPVKLVIMLLKTKIILAAKAEAQYVLKHSIAVIKRRPEKNYFFPDLHHMKFEIEDGTTVKGKEIRFGYDPEEFPSFSWRGYARMSSIQNEVRITLNVEKSNLYLFRIILRYINPGGESLSGRLSACQTWPETGAVQSKEFVFPPSKEPAFVTVPGNNSSESFSLDSGTWTVSIIAEEVLLVNLQMTINVPHFGRYILVFEYANEDDQLYTAEVTVNSPGPVTEGRVRIYSCKYSFLCRSVVVDDRNRIAAYDLMADTKIHLKASSINFLLNQITLTGTVPHLGKYVFVVHFYQPTHPTFPVHVHVNAGHVWSGSFSASFCPHSSGCRDQVIAENQIELDVSEPEVSVTLMIPDRRMLVLFVDMRNWSLEAMDENIDIPVTFNPVSNSVVADVQELPASVHSLYWKAPPSYLGEKLSSYGGFISYQVKSFGLPSEGMVLLDKKPEIKLTGQQMEIVYVDPNNPLPDRQYYGRVQLVEGNFRHASSNNLVSREELMIILSRLDSLHIRGLYFTETQRLTLGEVGLEEATSTGSGSIAYNVETCSCPPEYAGDSCQCSLLVIFSPCFMSRNVGLDFIVRIEDYLLDVVSPATAMEIQIGAKMVLGNVSTASIILLGKNVSSVKMVILEMPLKVPVEYVLALTQTGLQLAVWQMAKKYSVSAKKAILESVVNECFNNVPKDVDPNEDCDSCDSCVITLLKDLSTIGDELQLIKSQLQNVRADTNTLEQMRHLEIRIKDLKVLLNNYRSALRNQGSKADELEKEFSKLNHDVNALQEKAEMNYKAAEILLNNFGQTHQKGKDLVSRIQIVVNNIQVLLEQIAGMNSEGNNLPSGDAAKELAEAQRMMREMRNRNFGQLQTDAEKERTEARLLLARVKNELQKYHQENHGLVKIMRDSLNAYESKLTDLREALNEATGQTKQAENLNRENGVLLEDIKKRIDETNVQQDSILDILSSAQSSLTQANSMLGLLLNSKEEYESLSAQLDGARKDMNGKLTNSSLSASKEPLVVRAEEHAKSLQDLAKQLEEIKNNARKDELVGCAVEASTAYDNIINAIKAAEEAANKAGSAADSALSAFLCLSDDIDDIITSAKNMVKSAKDVTTNVLDELLPIQEDVEKMKGTYGSTQSAGFSKALTEANNSVKKLTNQLPDLFSKIESINQQLMPISNISENVNRIRELIQQARDAANKVAIPMRFNGSSGVEVRPPSNLEDLKAYTSLTFFLQRPQKRLDVPQRGSNKFVLYLGNKDSSKGYIGMAVKDGHLTCVYNLGDREAEVVVDPLVMQSDTEEAIMDQVKLERYKEESDQNYFEGTGYASVTSKETNANVPIRYEQTIQTTADEGIVFFAANEDQYISVLIKNGHPVFRYKIDSELPKEIENNVTLNDGTYKQISILIVRNKNIVHLSSVIKANIKVFDFPKYYLGGIPSFLRKRFNITIPPFRGCMKNVKNPKTASVIFDETVGVSKKCSDDWKPNILTIYLSPGFVNAKIGENEMKVNKEYEDGSVHYVTVMRKADRVKLLVDDDLDSKSFDFLRSQTLIEPLRFGGDDFEGCISNVFIERTGELPEVQNLMNFTAKTDVSLGACHHYENLEPVLMKEFKNPLRFKILKDEKYFDHLTYSNVQHDQQNYTSLTQLNVNSEVYLLGNTPNSFISYAFSPSSPTDRLHFSLDIRTQSSRGLIMFMEGRSEKSYMALHVSKGRFVFSLGSGRRRIKIKTSVKYNDGQWHNVVCGRDGENVLLVVDGLRAQHGRLGRLARNSTTDIKPPIYLGGPPSLKRQNIPMKSFKGCLRNFKMNGKVMNSPQQKKDVLPCLDAPMEMGIHFFKEGGYVAVDNLQTGLDFRIVFAIRPRSSTGVLLHSGSKPDNYLTIYMKEGKDAIGSNGQWNTTRIPGREWIQCISYLAITKREDDVEDSLLTSNKDVRRNKQILVGNVLFASGNGGAGEVQTSVTPQHPLTDGQWHTITVSQKENTVQLEVGTESNYMIRHPPFSPQYVQQPLYFGKIPANLDSLWLPVKDPFLGCLRNITINGKRVSTKRISEVHGAEVPRYVDYKQMEWLDTDSCGYDTAQ